MQLIGPAALLLVPSEPLLSTHSPTLEGWTVDLVVGLWLVVPTRGFEPTRVDLLTTRPHHHMLHSNPKISFQKDLEALKLFIDRFA